MAELVAQDIHVRYGQNAVLKGVSARFEDGEIVALLGRSGSGKSTLLRAIAGLETPASGSIIVAGRTLFDAEARINLPPEARDLGLVFQSYALWPHKTVAANVAYPLQLRKRPTAEVARAVDEVLAGVGLEALASRFPSELSGGQQQRVALARALVYSPPLILLDEPLSNLDAKLREEARLFIRNVIKARALTAIFVTHDQVEAMAIADRIMLLDQGRIVQQGSPQQLYTQPESLFVADFMGVNNRFDGPILERRNGLARIALGDQDLWGLDKTDGQASVGVGLTRVEGVRIDDQATDNRLAATLETSLYLGGRWEHVLRTPDGAQIRAETPGALAPGPYALHLPRDHLWVF
ncbi:ABC transporter ATP-binding protein [soil metagenome]